METIISAIKEDLEKIYPEGIAYDDPRQIFYVWTNQFVLPIASHFENLIKTGDSWAHEDTLSDQETAVLDLDYIKKNNIRVYRTYNKRGHHLLFRCQSNESMYVWDKLHEISLTIPRTITVKCSKHDIAGYKAKQFQNSSTIFWYLRKTRPDLLKLSPLAKWLVMHVPKSVAGLWYGLNHTEYVYCYSGLTKIEAMLKKAKGLEKEGITGPAFQGVKEVEDMRRVWGEEVERPQRMRWIFSVIDPGQGDSDYWNKEAEYIISSGVKSVSIGSEKFDILEVNQ